MLKFRTSKVIPLAAALSCALAAACSSGGGGGSTPVAGTTSSTTTSTGSTATTTGSSVCCSDTGIAGTVAAPAPGTFGTAPAQIATSGGPTFDGSSGSYPANATFPLITISLQKTSTGLSPVSPDQGATATVVSTSASGSTLQLTIPSLGVNQTLMGNVNLVSHLDSFTDGLSYVVMGGWAQRQPANSANVQNSDVFVFGYETPQSAMPTSGTAVFSAVGGVEATIYKPVGTTIQAASADGNASISVDFGSGAVTGSFTKMQISSTQLWNDVSVNANIATGTNRFSGSTAAASSPSGSMSLSGSATGHIDGAFYGPAAQNLGAVWSLSDGTGSAIGTVVAGH